MSLFRSFVCATALILVGADARANPYANQVLRTRAVPGPHVQISYAVVSGTMDAVLADLIGTVSTYGDKQTSWSYEGGYRANTGSGVVGLSSIQRCDCFVPRGSLTYRLTVRGRWVVPEPPNTTLTSTVTVSDSFDAALPPAGGLGFDGGRWNEPEPTEIQGLDCTVACATDEPDASVPDLRAASDLMTASPDVLASFPDAPDLSIDAASPVVLVDARASASEPSNTKSQGSKGCSISLPASGSGLPLVALLALLALRRRRHG